MNVNLTGAALVLVDIQNDFLPGGPLAVPEGDRIIPVVNRLQPMFRIVVATQDWHPLNHGSFAANHPGMKIYDEIDWHGSPQTLWPVHCVQHTQGAQLADDLQQNAIAQVFQKGVDPEIDSYSGFFDNGHRRATGLSQWLKSKKVTNIYVCGLAIDYCVKFTALDAVQLGFTVNLIENACRGVELRNGDTQRAVEDLRKAGVTVIDSAALGN